jgi:hypothetical protein
MSRFSIYTSMLNNITSLSRLTIYNFTQDDAGEFLLTDLCEEWNGVVIKEQSILHIDSVSLLKKKSPGSCFNMENASYDMLNYFLKKFIFFIFI